MDQRALQRQLNELAFVFQSLQLYLAHLEPRFALLLTQLERLGPGWQRRQNDARLLENELESSSLELVALQRELHQLGGLFQTQQGLLQAEKQATAHQLRELRQFCQDCERVLNQRQAHLLGLESQVKLSQEKYQAHILTHTQALQTLQDAHLELQADNARLERAVEAQEHTEQDYLQLLEKKEQQLITLKQLYESELEAFNQAIDDSSQSRQTQRLQSQDLGRSLARLAQERNLSRQDQQQLLDRMAALEQENQELQERNQALRLECDNWQAQVQRTQQLEEQWQAHYPQLPLAQLSYQYFYETLQGLGLQLSEAERAHLALGCQLNDSTRKLIEERLHWQPGRLQQLLEGLQAISAPSQPLSPITQSVWLDAGVYPLGDDLHAAERPAHSLQMAGFALARYLVTNADFARFLADGGYQQPDFWLPEGWQLLQEEGWHGPAFWNRRGYFCGEDYPDYPVVGVSWYEAVAYASWAGLRLPSESEWEAAGRGLSGQRWPWGERWEEGRANTADAGLMNTSPVGLYPSGASASGCLDLIGNVFEWTQSVYAPYPYRADDGREDLRSTAPRALRGCSWNHRGSYFTRLSYRFQAEPSTRHSDIGFRCAGDQLF
ncbi:MAG: SUMF1/EgtB/PvdO family nonheme iron enzyme [Candidatus Sericytochromatia bacterium]